MRLLSARRGRRRCRRRGGGRPRRRNRRPASGRPGRRGRATGRRSPGGTGRPRRPSRRDGRGTGRASSRGSGRAGRAGPVGSGVNSRTTSRPPGFRTRQSSRSPRSRSSKFLTPKAAVAPSNVRSGKGRRRPSAPASGIGAPRRRNFSWPRASISNVKSAATTRARPPLRFATARARSPVPEQRSRCTSPGSGDEEAGRLVSPRDVGAAGEEPVEEVVARRDPGEHRLDLPRGLVDSRWRGLVHGPAR